VKAVLLKEFGPPDVLLATDLPDPVAGPGQVVVRAAAISVVFVDTMIRAGRGPSPAHQPELPAIPGTGVGGTVVAVGEGVDADLVGTTVVARPPMDGYAEKVAVDAESLVPVPNGLDIAAATALLADGRTAMLLVDAAKPQTCEWVLVEAAGGGLGSLLVQLAVAAGARVVGAASRLDKLQLAKTLGAEVAVDYTDDDWPQVVRAATGGVDLVFDGVGGKIGQAGLTLVRPGGRISRYGMSGGAMTEVPATSKVDTIGLGAITPSRVLDATRRALAEAAAGRLTATVGQTFPLDRAADAHRAIESRQTIGKTLLIP
jgi:NADPH2:quinone reductase